MAGPSPFHCGLSPSPHSWNPCLSYSGFLVAKIRTQLWIIEAERELSGGTSSGIHRIKGSLENKAWKMRRNLEVQVIFFKTTHCSLSRGVAGLWTPPHRHCDHQCGTLCGHRGTIPTASLTLFSLPLASHPPHQGWGCVECGSAAA